MPSATRTRRARVNGVELDVYESGPAGGSVVILSHGFPEAAHSWRHTLPALGAAGYHAIAPDQRGYGRSSKPSRVEDYGIRQLCGDLLGLLDETGQEQAVFVGHDWGALIVWELARLFPSRVRGVVGVSVPFVAWPGPPTQLMRMMFGDNFFYILYFQQVGPPEAELEADVRRTMSKVLWGASGAGFAPRIGQPLELRPMAGTGFLTQMADPPALPWDGPEGPWLTAADLDRYTDLFTASGFFGPVSYYRNLDANYEIVKDVGGPERLTMPSAFIGGAQDPVLVMDPSGLERMKGLADFRGSTLIDGVGHWTQQEAPSAFNQALLAFLGQL
jgi:pimeloyl-ACP methyl ester carboxylesterase